MYVKSIHPACPSRWPECPNIIIYLFIYITLHYHGTSIIYIYIYFIILSQAKPAQDVFEKKQPEKEQV